MMSEPSKLVSKLSVVKHGDPTSPVKKSSRSTDFKTKTVLAPKSEPSEVDVFGTPISSSSTQALKRDHDLTVIEDLSVGPIEHKPPFDDPHFERLEPNSGIRLT